MMDDITMRCIVGDLLELIEGRQLQSVSGRSQDAERRLTRYHRGHTDWRTYASPTPTRQPETGPDQGAG